MIQHLNDPIFKSLPTAYNLLDYAKQKKIMLYLIDALPFDMWENDGLPVAVTNSIVLHKFPAEKLFRLPDTWCGMYYHPYSLQSTVPVTRAFNCYMHRMDPFRQSWLYLLVRRELFDQGYISFNMETSRLPEAYKDCDSFTVFQKQFEQYCSNFQTEHQFVSKLVPYCNFTDNDDVTPVCYASKISLVLETYFDNNNVITYSEKIFRALQIPRPWLLFSHCRAVKYLKNMGFDVLDDIIDHESYDSLECAVARQSQILDLMPALIAKPMDDNRLVQAAHHNQDLLARFSKTWLQDIKSVIDQASTHA